MIEHYWSRVPGKFVVKKTGESMHAINALIEFDGTIREWYETFVECINDLRHASTSSSSITFDAGAIAFSIIETSAGYKSSIASNAGTLNGVPITLNADLNENMLVVIDDVLNTVGAIHVVD